MKLSFVITPLTVLMAGAGLAPHQCAASAEKHGNLRQADPKETQLFNRAGGALNLRKLRELVDPSLALSKSVVNATSTEMDQNTITGTLKEIYNQGTTVGFAVAVVDEQGEVVYEKGFGQSNQRKGRPYTTKTVQPIASISKTLLGMALMKCQEMGVLELDDPINDYLPFSIVNPFFPGTAITIRHLATHTSSILDSEAYALAYVYQSKLPKKKWTTLPKGSDEREYFQDLSRSKDKDMPLEDFIYKIQSPNGKWYDASESFSQGAAPGEAYAYSNVGAAIAALVIEGALTKVGVCMPYTKFVDNYITKPLKMKSSGWNMADFKQKKKSKLYPFGRTTDPAIAIPDYNLITVADGGFVTNAKDMSKYLGAVMQGYVQGQENVLTAKSYQQMVDGSIFWQNPVFGEGSFFGHAGGDPGVNTLAFVDPDSKYAFYFAANTEDIDTFLQVLYVMLEFAAEQ